MDSKRETATNTNHDGASGDPDLAGAVKQLAGRLDLRSLERLFILQTLAAVNGSRKVAVARLGISERTLRNKLHLYRHSPFN
jgi:two-component system, response regulator FlrC